ncbi:sigma-70 family RNA polymerase sigma factor [Bacillus sp. FJAT-42376]|uniref:sigma-70 family RNA polymerase sigma factor n=1 Tax=Bacillus sp. FJAT-42376 TaxID=2014076 RepID=UPI000F4E43B9|nr:sigma-70 family RNA polymerase sigma factor [Bacillus sp. FJAT-42376]AZB42563.1 sigma-70 family RNA polymerase sigma factor [Bacillus sp. FJAT-42376]
MLMYSELLERYKPMILHLMKRLSIYRNHEEFFQTASIALWEASNHYQPSKGTMDAYYYLFIKGKLMNEMTRQNRLLMREDLKDEWGWADSGPDDFLPAERYDWEDLMKDLTLNQKKWIRNYAFLGLTITEIAQKEGATPAAVKSWRRDAIKKLRDQLQER